MNRLLLAAAAAMISCAAQAQTTYPGDIEVTSHHVDLDADPHRLIFQQVHGDYTVSGFKDGDSINFTFAGYPESRVKISEDGGDGVVILYSCDGHKPACKTGTIRVVGYPKVWKAVGAEGW